MHVASRRLNGRESLRDGLHSSTGVDIDLSAIIVRVSKSSRAHTGDTSPSQGSARAVEDESSRPEATRPGGRDTLRV